VKKRIMVGSAISVIALLVAGAAAVAGPLRSSSASTLPSTCGPVFYKGSGSPKYIVVSDLPLQGAGRAQNLEMQQAIRYVLDKQYHFKVGKYTVGYAGCDDSTAQAGRYDPATCTANATAYASTSNVIGILGTFNSGCSKVILPIVNRAPGGAIPMISSANTAVGLTHFAPWNSPGEPGIYYPTKVRNYFRVAATDDYQGPSMVPALQHLKKVKKVYILNDQTTFGAGVAAAFQARAKKVGMTVAGYEPWDLNATDYTALAQKIKNTGATAVYLGGLVCDNGVKLLKDLRAVLGPGVQFAGPDGWTPESATLAAGEAAQGMYISYAGQPLSKLGKPGKAFILGLRKYSNFKGQMPPYPVYQGQSAQAMFAAIAKSNGTRSSVVANLHKLKVVNGIMGTFHFDKNGDIVPFKWISIEQLKGNAGVYAYAVVTKVKG